MSDEELAGKLLVEKKMMQDSALREKKVNAGIESNHGIIICPSCPLKPLVRTSKALPSPPRPFFGPLRIPKSSDHGILKSGINLSILPYETICKVLKGLTISSMSLLWPSEAP